MPRRIVFEPFVLDTETRQLLREPHHQLVHLSPKAFELLCVLVKNRPKAMAKRELHEQLWPTTFVSEATLASLIGELREALGERGRQARFIRTVHGFGYAFSGVALEGEPDVTRVMTWVVCNGHERPLAPGEHVLGRDDSASIALISPTVSRHHAKIVIAGEIATLEDLDSKNGTFVRGKAVTSPVQLADGDLIRIGAFELTFRTVSGKGSTDTQAK